MNKLYLGLSLFLVSLQATNAQSDAKDPCTHKLKVASTYLTAYENADHDLLNQITTSVEACIESNTPESLYVQGNLILRGNPSEEEQSMAFSLIEKSALQGNKDAACLLGDMLKNAQGTNLDFDKAMDWYKKAATLGSEKAAFKIGYTYLKGLGTTEQSYQKATHWFQSSSYPMAKHWLAICHYFGYGVPEDKNRGISMLQDSQIQNSKTVLQQFEKSKSEVNRQNKNTEAIVKNSKIPDEIKNSSASQQQVSSSPVAITSLSDTYIGKLIEYDWSGKHIVRTTPIEMELDYDAYDNTMDYKIAINDIKKSGSGSVFDQEIYIDNLSVSLKKIFTDNKDEQHLSYKILSIAFSTKTIHKKTYLVGAVDSYIENWNEPAPPIQLVLTKTSNEWDLSDDALHSFLNQNSFIKLYPNPVKTDVLVHYELDTPSRVRLELQGISNTSYHKVVEQETEQPSGKKLYRINSIDLPIGTYLIKIQVNDKQYTKLIIKQ